MYSFRSSTLIRVRLQYVFDYVNDPANNTCWQRGVESSGWTSDRPIGVGSTFTVVRTLLGQPMEAILEITCWDPPRQVTVRTIGGPVPVEMTTSYEELAGGTLLTMKGHADLGGFLKPVERFIGKQAKRQLAADLAALKLLLEVGQT